MLNYGRQLVQILNFLTVKYLNLNSKMNWLLTLLMLSSMINLINADSLQTIEKVLNYPQTKNMKRVTKFQPVTYNYALLTTPGTLTEYPGLTISFYLPFSQFIDLKYSVSPMWSNGPCFLVTRVLVDGTENPVFRVITGNSVFHTNFFQDTMWLEKGSHTVLVQYRTDCSLPPIVTHDFNYAFLKVEYSNLAFEMIFELLLTLSMFINYQQKDGRISFSKDYVFESILMARGAYCCLLCFILWCHKVSILRTIQTLALSLSLYSFNTSINLSQFLYQKSIRISNNSYVILSNTKDKNYSSPLLHLFIISFILQVHLFGTQKCKQQHHER